MMASDSTVQRTLDSQVVIVTGGGSGIGRATCMALARAGASVVVVGRTSQHVDATIGELVQQVDGVAALGLALDVRQEQDMDEMAHQTLLRFGRIDGLVACAGVSKRPGSTRLVPYALSQLPNDEWDAVLDTNLKGIFLSNRAVLPTMIAQRSGRITNIASSPGGLRGQPFAAAYCASKFGVVGLSESLAEEVRPYGIRVHVLFPDATDTPLLHNSTLAARLGTPIPPARVADLIVSMIALPGDSCLVRPVIAPGRLPL